MAVFDRLKKDTFDRHAGLPNAWPGEHQSNNRFGGPIVARNPVGGGFSFTGAGAQQQETKNPYQVLETQRSGELADRIKSIMGSADKQQKQADKAIGKYESALNRAPNKGFADQESNYLSRFFDSRAQKEMEGMRVRQADALRRAGDLARGNLRRDLKASGFARGGGSSSRLDRMALDRNQAIESDLANRMAAAVRGDYDSLNRMRGAALGQRGSMYDRLAARELLPLQARQQQLQAQAGLLGNMGQQQRANTLYHLAESPEYTQDREYQAMLAQQGMSPMRMPGTNYVMDMNQTDPFARFPKAPFVGYGVNPMNNLYGYQYAAPQYSYPNVLGQV